MSDRAPRAGLGLGWRPEVAGVAVARNDLGFVEVLAEAMPGPGDPLPLGLTVLGDRGVEVVVHGVGLSLGGSERPEPGRLARLAGIAARLGAPLVSDHLAHVRTAGTTSGHLLPVPRTWAMVSVLVANIRIAQDQLPVPLAVEPVAALFEWPGAELTEADFVAEVVERSGAPLLLDLANVYVNARNFGFDPRAYLERMPLERLAYVHVAGGRIEDGVHHDTHAERVWPEVLDLLAALVARQPTVRVLLERDDDFGPDADLHDELDTIAAVLGSGASTGATRGWPSVAAPAVTPLDGSASESGFGFGFAGHDLDGDGDGDADADADADADGDGDRPRRALAEVQGRLLAALVAGGPAPDGFDGDRIDRARRSLLAKRTREVAQRWPATAALLGDRFAPRFAAYAAARPRPPGGGSFEDGATFVATLGDVPPDDLTRAEWRAAGVNGGRRFRSRRRGAEGVGVRTYVR